MKSLIMKSVYAGLGLLGTGKETVEQLGRKLARQADISEQEGRKIAHDLHERSEKALQALHKTLEAEASKVVKAYHAATKGISGTALAKKPASRAKSKRKA